MRKKNLWRLYTWRQIRANIERANACHTPRVGGGADETGAGDGSHRAPAAGGACGRRGARQTQALGADAELARVVSEA